MASRFVNTAYWFCESQFPASKTRADLFTHLFCGHAGLDPESYEVTVSPLKQDQIAEFSSTVQKSNPSVKTLLSIGGEDGKADRFAAMAAASERRDAFIKSSISVARKYSFDGLDLQWLYPSSKEEMDNLRALLIDWRIAVVEDAEELDRTPLLLVATVFYSPRRDQEVWYPVETIQETMDWINVISYDFYTPTSSNKQTGPSSALYNQRDISPSGAFGIKTWITEHLAADKIVLGIPFYGWAWTLESSEKHDLFSPADGTAKGHNISSDGLIEYSNVKKFITDNHATNVPVEKSCAIAYAYFETTWITYDDEETIKIKIKEAKRLGLLGYFAWDVAGDDEDNTLAKAASREWRGA